MSPFEFFFSFYGLLLGLSVAVIATGAARAFKHRKTVRVGWLTTLLATFVALDIATFWDAAWNNFRHLSFSYGLIIAGLVIAMVYFIAASLLFPEPEDEVASLDEHFWANKRAVLLLLIGANLLNVTALVLVNLTREHGLFLIGQYAITAALYVVLTGAAAFTRRRWLFGAAIGFQVALYLFLAVASVILPQAASTDEDGQVTLPPAVAAPDGTANRPSALPSAPERQ